MRVSRERHPPLLFGPRGEASAVRWLCAELRAAILDGRLGPGARLPATRELALSHRLSRGTIVAAFEQMKAEGYVTGRVGSGTFVNGVLPDRLLAAARPRPSNAPGASGARPAPTSIPLSAVGRRLRAFPASTSGPARAFRTNQPALNLFPTTLWAQVASRRLRRASASLLRSSDVFGYVPLRRAVADYLAASRGVICEPGQIAIVSGVQEALDLVARVFLNPGDRVWIENPAYIGATIAFEAAGAAISPLEIDGEGMALPPRRAQPARLAYVTPAHQFPLGVAMSLPRRLALIDWARQTRALIFEDDYDSEYRYAGASLPALQGLDRHGVVLFAGTFSKTLFPSLRLGYLVAPPHLVDPLAAMKSVTSRFAPVLEQAVLCDFITEGHFGRHVRRMRQIYAGRLHALLEASRQRLADVLEISPVEAGLQTTAWLRGGRTAAAVAAAAAERNVEVTPLTRYCRQPVAREGLVLGFAAVDEREIERGVSELASVLNKVRVKADTARGNRRSR